MHLPQGLKLRVNLRGVPNQHQPSFICCFQFQSVNVMMPLIFDSLVFLVRDADVLTGGSNLAKHVTHLPLWPARPKNIASSPSAELAS